MMKQKGNKTKKEEWLCNVIERQQIEASLLLTAGLKEREQIFAHDTSIAFCTQT